MKWHRQSRKKYSFIDKSLSHGTFSTVIEKYAGIAQLVERCLAKAKVAGSSPVSRSSLHLSGPSYFAKAT